MPHIFISYAHVDSDFVALLKLELEKFGLQVWVDRDRLRAGEDWRQGIDEAITSAFALITVMSPEAYNSSYVTYEWAFALGIGIPVIPVMLRGTEMHPRLEVLQYMDFRNPTSRPWELIAQRLTEIEQEYRPIHGPYRSPPMVRQAVAALNSHSPDERQQAIESLAQTNHPSALEALADAIKHPLFDVRTLSSLKLATLTNGDDKRAAPGLTEALKHDDYQIRRSALQWLRHFRGANVAADIGSLLQDDDEYVRFEAVEALCEIDDEGIIPFLIEALADNSSKVRETASDGLFRRKSQALNYLFDALHQGKGAIREAALRKLVEIGSPSIPGLTKCLTSDSDWIRWAATEALGKIGDDAATPHLIDRLQDEEWPVRQSALAALEKIGTPTAREAAEMWHEAVNQMDELTTRAAAHMDKSEYNEAVELYNQVLPYARRLNSEAKIMNKLAVAYEFAGQLQDAIDIWQKLVDTQSDFDSHIPLSRLYEEMADHEKAAFHLTRARENVKDGDYYNRACIESIAGNFDSALDCLRLALEKKPSIAIWAEEDPDLKRVRQDHRFDDLIKLYS